MIHKAVRVALLLLLGQPALALDLVVGDAAPSLREASPADTHAVATGPWSPEGLPLRTLDGAVSRRAWTIEGAATTLQLLEPLRRQIESAGLQILFECETEDCGGFDFRRGIEVLPAPAMFVNLGDFRYLSAEGPGEGLSILVSRSGDRGYVQVVEVLETMGPPPPPGAVLGRPTEAEGPPLPAGAAALGERIETEGRVVLEGLAFGTGSSDLASGASAALASLAAYLNADPLRRVAIVGHTDAQGTLQGNIALSKRRAEAVAARLSEEFGVSPSQLEAEGMGYLAPLATNLTPEGRERNRRVEAVILAAR